MKEIEHFSASKKLLQRLGSWVVRRASGTDVPDTTSGFRAYNREAALQIQVVSNYTYTLESLIQAGKMLVAVEHVPIATNPETRDSRLVDSTARYVRRNAVAVFRAYVLYEPLRVFTIVACVLAVAALAAWAPFLLDWILHGDRTGHIQSLILGAVLALAAVQMFGLGRRRRRDRRPARDRPADLRAGPPTRARGRASSPPTTRPPARAAAPGTPGARPADRFEPAAERDRSEVGV